MIIGLAKCMMKGRSIYTSLQIYKSRKDHSQAAEVFPQGINAEGPVHIYPRKKQVKFLAVH